MQSPTVSEPARHAVWGDSSRPKLRTDALWVPHDDGAFLLCNASSLTIRGKSSYELVSRIAPHLDGTADVAQLVSGLPPPVAEQVRGLLKRLAEAGFVRDAAVDRPHGLTDREVRDYAGELAFIEYFCDSPAARYEAFRDTPMLCVGSGLVLEGLVRALVQLGNRRVTAALTGGEPAAAGLEAALKSALATAGERDPGMGVRIVGLGELDASDAELAGLVAAHDFVLHFADDFDPRLAERIDTVSAQAGKPVLHGAVHEDHVWLGPLCEPREGVRGPDLWARTGVAAAGRRSVFLAEPTARIVAAQLAFAAFKTLTGIPADDFRERAVRVDLATLVSDEVNLRALALLPVEGEAEALPTTTGWTAALPPSQPESALMSRQFSPLVDARDGLIRDVDEGMLTQIPLHRCRAEVAPLGGTGHAVTAQGDGPDLLSARVAAVLAAAEAAGLAALGQAAVHGTTENAAPPDGVEAVDLVTGATVTVTARQLAAWRDSSPLMAIASAADREDAVACALGRMAGRLLRSAGHEEGTPCSADAPEVPRLISILEAAGHRPVLRTLGDVGGWAVVRADCGDGLVGIGSAPTAAAAGGDALYDAVRGLQERVFHEPLRPHAVGHEEGGPAVGHEDDGPGPVGHEDEDDGSRPAAQEDDGPGPVGPTTVARAAQWLQPFLPPATRLLGLSLEAHPALRAVGRTHCAAVVILPASGEVAG
ncbi:hypothetical protein [Streptomyces huasconensis]|uniref:hypothetical protein n=1 Tax=Streptomyces huasconensis TaxID=1854574 RepID=UPI0036F75D1D